MAAMGNHGGMRTQTFEFRTGDQAQVRDITDACDGFLQAGDEGLLSIFVPHATAGVAILETGAGSDQDLLAALADLLPADHRWQHRHGSPGHGRDHVLPALIAPYATVPVIAGRLQLGTWQSICLVDTNVDNAVRTVRLSFVTG
jgi:secondary thiamine-phosphate synthase enzyme